MKPQTARNQPSRMKKLVHFLCRLPIHRRNITKLLFTCHPDLLDGFEIFHQCLSPCRLDTLNIIQNRMDLSLASKQTVIFNSKPMHFILDSRNQLKPLTGVTDRNLMLLIVQPPCPVIVIFDLPHTGIVSPSSASTCSATCTCPFPPSIRIRSGN